MTETSAALAQSITWANSKQAFYTARFMATRGLANDCYRAYGYLRWADDTVDISTRSRDERISFIKQQRELIVRLYSGDRPDDLGQEEEMLADLVSHDQDGDSGLRSFISDFLAILDFDAHRKGGLISQAELKWYSDCLGRSVTEGMQYFMGNGRPPPPSHKRYLAATAAHITHMLRDMRTDIAEGFINIPHEYLEGHRLNPENVQSPAFRAWVRDRVGLARQYFREGKQYLDDLEDLRCKVAGYWYCARFEHVLNAIERDGFILRAGYEKGRSLPTLLALVRLSVAVTLRHIARRAVRVSMLL